MGDFLTDYSPEESKWDYHRNSVDKISYFYQFSNSRSHNKLATRMDNCANLLQYLWEQNFETGENYLSLKNASFCRVRLCPVCQWRRSMAWRARMFLRLPSLLRQHPDYSFLFLTLTVKNCEIGELDKTITHMNEAFRHLFRLKALKPIKGYIRSTEVTKSGEMGAHPHFHCILAVDKTYFAGKNYLSNQKWAELWKQSLKADYQPVVDIRKIKVQGGRLESKAIIETLKYSTKIESLVESKDWFLIYSDQIIKKRFLATGGCFKNFLKESASNAEMIGENEEEEDDSEYLFFGWNDYFRKYKKLNF